jgi:anti-sigma regulatory factor (Ser/Thr protein kinase)
MRFKLKAVSLLDDIHHWVKNQPSELTKAGSENIKIALGEVLQNIIRHAYKNNLNENDFVDIQYKSTGDDLTFIVRDYAAPCHPASFLNKHFSPNESGHMGLSIIRKLTNEFTIKPMQDGNETKLLFKFNQE